MVIRDSLAAELSMTLRREGFESALDIMLEAGRECVYVLMGDRSAPGAGAKRSWIEGLPLLHPSANLNRGASLEFLIALDFSEIPAFSGSPLPRIGQAWFFSDAAHGTSPPVHVKVAYRASSDPTDGSKDTGFGDADPTDGKYPINRSPVTFQLGISLPWGRLDFIDALMAELSRVLPEPYPLGTLVEPKSMVGQIGGYASDTSGDIDPNRRVALEALGRIDSVPYDHWRSVEEFDRFLNSTSPFGEKNARSFSDIEAARSQVRWLSDHADEVAAEAESWKLLLNLEHMPVQRFGDGGHLSIFVRQPTAGGVPFETVAAVVAH